MVVVVVMAMRMRPFFLDAAPLILKGGYGGHQLRHFLFYFFVVVLGGGGFLLVFL